MQTNKGIARIKVWWILPLICYIYFCLLTDDPSSEENGECFTCKYKIDDGAYIWKDQKKRLLCGLVFHCADFTFRQKREF